MVPRILLAGLAAAEEEFFIGSTSREKKVKGP